MTRKAALICGLVALWLAAPVSALAGDICEAVALVDVPAQGDPDPIAILHKGETDEAVTQYRVNKRTGDGVFCSHGGDCYPRFLTIGGQRVEALRLTNCKIGGPFPADLQDPQSGEVLYGVDVDRSKNSADTLRRDDIENALQNMGMSGVGASNAADLYLKDPRSRCGDLVGRALGGDKRAISVLGALEPPDFCLEMDEAADNAPTPAAANANAATPPAAAPAVPSAKPVNPMEVALVIGAFLYFLPSLIGFLRRKRNAPAIFALNLFLGWTFLGWVGALVWSLVSDPALPTAPV